ncbi:hypothetical protein ACEN2J_04440 [Pseudorhodobacter sp. W20_MBD10_FR17]|uniref:hypothetical protein n=1 Tax=Pseudorhodobacter sp. W20_MBD10_FR17 TaxID=3240266 RepID=UPI003F9677C6
MRHDWIFDVLADLRAYADQNNLPALAAQVTAALRVADLEISDEAVSQARRQALRAEEESAKLTRRAH